LKPTEEGRIDWDDFFKDPIFFPRNKVTPNSNPNNPNELTNFLIKRLNLDAVRTLRLFKEAILETPYPI